MSCFAIYAKLSSHFELANWRILIVIRFDLKFQPATTSSITSYSLTLIIENVAPIIEICFSDFCLLSFVTRTASRPDPSKIPPQRVSALFVVLSAGARLSRTNQFSRWYTGSPKKFAACGRSLSRVSRTPSYLFRSHSILPWFMSALLHANLSFCPARSWAA